MPQFLPCPSMPHTHRTLYTHFFLICRVQLILPMYSCMYHHTGAWLTYLPPTCLWKQLYVVNPSEQSSVCPNHSHLQNGIIPVIPPQGHCEDDSRYEGGIHKHINDGQYIPEPFAIAFTVIKVVSLCRYGIIQGLNASM